MLEKKKSEKGGEETAGVKKRPDRKQTKTNESPTARCLMRELWLMLGKKWAHGHK